MAERSIPVDLFNPGQVFACLGFLEAAEVLIGGAEGGFDWSNETDPRFIVRIPGDDDPVAVVLEFLVKAEVRTAAPWGSDLSTKKWDIETLQCEGHYYPFAKPASPATLVAEAFVPEKPRLVFSHWGDTSSRDNVKFWAGAAGYPGVALLKDALDIIRAMPNLPLEDPFNACAQQSSAFRFDWRRDYIPIDVGFSPNKQASIVMVGYPIVEVLAAYGLNHARPSRLKKLAYRYGVVEGILPLVIQRAALGATQLPFRQRMFHMHLDWPGQKDQARCITDVVEETIP